jgi:hypothetical protein
MNIGDQLCEAFCGTLKVSKVPAGFAVGTGHRGTDGDPVGFYVIGPDINGKYRVQDDGLSMPTLEANGVDLSNASRLAAFESLRGEYGVEYDEESDEVMIVGVDEEHVGAASMRFVAFLLRLQDMLLMSIERTASTFKEDALKVIRELVGDRAVVQERFVVDKALEEIPADVGIFVEGGTPVALFFGLTEARLYEALLLQAYAEKQQIAVSVVAMLETESSVTKKMRQRVNNHLDAVPIFRGDERAAAMRVVRPVIGALH